MNKPVFAILLAAILITPIIAHESFAENSNCRRDCEAPTFGALDDGRVIVVNGLTINGQAFNVTGFTQTIPSQTLVVGQQNTVKMIVYENDGTKSLRYTSFALADYKGERDQTQKARIAFVQDFDGTQKLDILDYDKVFSNVKYNATTIDSFTTVIEFTFDIAKPVSKSSIIIEAWDDERNARKAVLLDGIQVDDKSMEKVKEDKMMKKKAEKKTP
ncbi:MAG: hypothetical protein EB164_09940, partial [Thaumarchaeota archaeon]|nr:hypothetical protein [Nitrososphaerota archaeon]